MRGTLIQSLFFGAVLLAASSAVSEDDQAADVKNGVTQLAQAFSQAWEAGDASEMAALFDGAGDLVTATGHRSKGRSEIEATLAEEHSGYMRGTQFRIEVGSVQSLAPGVALLDGSALLAGVKTSDGKRMPSLRHLVFAVAIQLEGSWRLRALRITVPVPSPAQG